MSLARRHFERTKAAASAPIAAATPADGPAASEYTLLLAALGADLNTLRNIESVERKIEAKRTMIERYLPWVEGAVKAETPTQDEIVANMLVWAMDVAMWPLAFELAEHVLKHGLSLPERYSRKPATLIAEEFAEAGLKTPPGIDLFHLQAAEALVEQADIHDQVRAKLQKALGLAFAAKADAFDPEAESASAGGKAALIAAALHHFTRALSLDAKCGVKKLIEGLEREAKRLAAP